MNFDTKKHIFRRVASFVTAAALALNILPRVTLFTGDISAEAASIDSEVIGKKFESKMQSLGWVNVGVTKNHTNITDVNNEMWAETGLTPYSGINDESRKRGSLEYKTADGGTGSFDLDSFAQNPNAEQLGDSGIWNDANKFDQINNPMGWRDNNAGTAKYINISTNPQEPYDPNNTLQEYCANSNYYELKQDTALDGWYREYTVSTADQLAYILCYYQLNFGGKLKATQKEITNAGLTGLPVNKLGIVLENDLDLGGANDKHWVGFTNSSVALDINGNGHTVYNGYFTDNKAVTQLKYNYNTANNTDSGVATTIYTDYFVRSDQKFAVHDINFSNMFIGRIGGMFGSASNCWFNNVNWEHCLAANESGASSRTSIVFADGYNYVHLKDCTISNSYITGDSHSGLFASYNGGPYYCEYKSYIGDTDSKLEPFRRETETRIGKDSNETAKLKHDQGYYYHYFPDTVEEAECAWYGKSVILTDDGNTYWMCDQYPSIYENCATVDSVVYDIGGEHSGTFVSCMQSHIIFKQCFSNCTIYAKGKQGVFIGACIGSGDGFYYPYNGTKTFVNSYFEDCYTSGQIEGNTNIGGFVGMIFNDSRAFESTGSSHRGKVVFKNCYSTSSVGMEYSTNCVGGFVGGVIENVQGDPSIQYDGDDIVTQHIFDNCYAAGEVGGIITDTSTDESNTNTIGGFMGTYVNFKDGTAGTKLPEIKDCMPYTVPVGDENPNYVAKLINCYYDKQTTAMRERDIGNSYASYYEEKTGHSLNHTLEGLTGVYTKASKTKRIEGLADTVKFEGSNAWIYNKDYYPQLASLTQKPNYTPNDAADKMRYDRQLMYYNYSVASTAAVLLDHYDEVLAEDGTLENANPTTYDTVRDITRKFEFTTDDGNGIEWGNDEERNEESGFKSKMGPTDSTGFSVSYEYDGGTGSVEHDPDVMSIVRDETDGNKYKCFEFAPGKQWVSVTAGTGDSAGKRDLRLLPTAYLNAGGDISINVVVDENTDTVTNEYTYKDNKLNDFDHYAGVAYAITDKYRMDSTNIYNNQVLKKYEKKTDKNSFALYGGYLLTGDSTAVGLNEDGKMYPQEFSGTGYENNSSNGLTMIKVYKTERRVIKTDDEGNDTFVLDKGDEIDLSDKNSDNYKKWTGADTFDSEDTGYYYMKYFWRLNDGRYLTDYKLVKIKSSSHNVQIITGVLNEEHTVDEKAKDDEVKAPVDQYVTDEINESSTETGEKEWDHTFISQDAGFSKDNAAEYYDKNEYSYNSTKVYNNEMYYVKSKTIVSTTANSAVGWHRSSDYRLTTLIIEAQTPSGDWVEMARVDKNSPTFDFSNAQYQYKFSGYKVTQDPQTKLFTVEEQKGVDRTFNVVQSTAGSGIENYILFDFQDSTSGVDYDSSDSIRVTALFRKNDADVAAEKNVLMNAESKLTEIGDGKYNSLSEADSDYEVNNRDGNVSIEDKAQRKAVLGGDELTYRVKLTNAGYYDSDIVNVYDEIPNGCTYVDGSMKIYRQHKDFSSGTAYYGALDIVTNETINNIGKFKAEYDENTRKFHWTLPTVEIDYDYYVEYKVKTDLLEPTKESRLLENTANIDFSVQNGDLDLGKIIDDTDTSLSYYKSNAPFTMATEIGEENGNTVYTVSFKQSKDGSYNITSFENDLPEGFTLDVNSVELKKNDETVTDPSITIKTENRKITIEGLTVENGANYTLEFKGTQTAPTYGNDVTNYASIYYYKSSDEKTAMANSVTKTSRVTNTVETDVTHLYLNVKKTIENADPSQTFLFKIERFEDEDAAKPEETFYTRVRCSADADGKYTGEKLVQVDKRGFYKITEMTDWSATDYDLGKAQAVDVSGSLGTKNGDADAKGSAVIFALPRYAYKSLAFPTVMGTFAEGSYPTAAFTDTESKFAYRSGQAYAENKFAS